MCDDKFTFEFLQIIKAGTMGDHIYFLTTGTGSLTLMKFIILSEITLFIPVCVTTANGKELCHLHEGEYFGEIEMALKNNKVKNVFISKSANIVIVILYQFVIFYPSAS